MNLAFRIWPLLLVSVFLVSAGPTTPTPGLERVPLPSRLVIGLDGVSLQTMLKLYDGGHFHQFNRPSAMVASFPSISDPNWNRLMRTPVGRGYTKAYFDVTLANPEGKGQIHGNLLEHLKDVTNYERGFDFKAEGVFEHFVSVTWIETTALYWLDGIEQKFFESRGRESFYAFIINTDLLVHVQGEAALMEYLDKVDQRIAHLRERYKRETGKDLEVTLVSDHGNSYAESFKMIALESALKAHGWNLTDHLKGPKDVVYVGPEILSFAALYCAPEASEKLARDVSSIEGVHVSMYESEPNEIRFFERGGKDEAVARVALDPKSLSAFGSGSARLKKLSASSADLMAAKPSLRFVDYRRIKGTDPLSQALYFKKGPLSWEQYFENSLRDAYPYSAVRVWEAFHVNSELPGQVLVSAKLGYGFENPTLKMILAIKGLKSMHGSLHRDETLGIFMSTKGILPAIRPENFGDEIDLSEFNHSPSLVKDPKAKEALAPAPTLTGEPNLSPTPSPTPIGKGPVL